MTFLGLPIKGEITHGSKRADQKPLEEFTPILEAVLEDPTITEIGWYQYTPYWNDGEACVFRVGGLDKLTVDGVEIEEFPYISDEDEKILGKQERKYNYDRELGHGYYTYIGKYEGPNEERYKKIVALSTALEAGQFDDALLVAFGDHAEVKIVPKDGIYVEFYEHE